MFFGMGGHGGQGGGCGCVNGDSIWLLILLNCFGCGVGKDDILDLLFLVMLLDCMGCGFGCGK